MNEVRDAMRGRLYILMARARHIRAQVPDTSTHDREHRKLGGLECLLEEVADQLGGLTMAQIKDGK